MYTFFFNLKSFFETNAVTLFMVFFVYVWVLWTAKFLLSKRYRHFVDHEGAAKKLKTTVIVPVYNEPLEIFEEVLSNIVANEPDEIIVVVDGGDSDISLLASRHAGKVINIEKAGKRSALAEGFAAACPDSEIFVIVDSDTIWEEKTLPELLKPFIDPRVGGVTPHQRISSPDLNSVRRLANWVEDLRYNLTVPAQSCFGQVGCLAGRTIAYRREALEPGIRALVEQSVVGVPMEIGDDRVLSNEVLRRDWRTVYQSTSRVSTDAPNDWISFWKQQIRWGRSSQRETLLSLRWLVRKPVAAFIFISDILVPFVVYTLLVLSVLSVFDHQTGSLPQLPIAITVICAYLGMVVSIGLRQIPHFRRKPNDVWWISLFVLQLTFFMVPARIFAFSTMFHNKWGTRDGNQA